MLTFTSANDLAIAVERKIVQLAATYGANLCSECRIDRPCVLHNFPVLHLTNWLVSFHFSESMSKINIGTAQAPNRRAKVAHSFIAEHFTKNYAEMSNALGANTVMHQYATHVNNAACYGKKHDDSKCQQSEEFLDRLKRSRRIILNKGVTYQSPLFAKVLGFLGFAATGGVLHVLFSKLHKLFLKLPIVGPRLNSRLVQKAKEDVRIMEKLVEITNSHRCRKRMREESDEFVRSVCEDAIGLKDDDLTRIAKDVLANLDR